MVRKWVIVASTAMLLLIFYGRFGLCAEPPVPDAIDTEALSVDEKNEYQRKAGLYLQDVEQWKARMNARLTTLEGQAKEKISRLVPEIQSRLEETKQKLEALKYSTSQDWEARTRDLDNSVAHLRQAHYQAVAALKEERKSYEGQLESKIQELKTEIKDLRVEAQQNARTDLNKEIEKLDGQRKTAEAKLALLQKATEERWVDMKTDLDQFFTQWDNKIHRILARLKEPMPVVAPAD
jgi:hypothetical protein